MYSCHASAENSSCVLFSSAVWARPELLNVWFQHILSEHTIEASAETICAPTHLLLQVTGAGTRRKVAAKTCALGYIQNTVATNYSYTVPIGTKLFAMCKIGTIVFVDSRLLLYLCEHSHILCIQYIISLVFCFEGLHKCTQYVYSTPC